MCACVCVKSVQSDEGEYTVDPLDVMRSLKTFYGVDDGGEGLESGRVGVCLF